jgi:F-type H+-transporting ATPase subunit b
MISLDYTTIVYQIILFVVLWLILNKLLFRPYMALLEERESKTSGARHDTGDLEHEGARLKAQYDEKIAQGQAAGAAAKEAILQAARQQREIILTQAREQAASALERARQDVRNQMQNERQLAATEVATVARDMARKILGRNVG